MENLFEDFLVAGLSRPDGSTSPLKSASQACSRKLLYHFKTDVDASAVIEFCFPDVEDTSSPSESFTFTLTQDDSTRVFGFCRRLVRPSQLPICLCVLSRRPWFSLFMHMHDILQLNYDLGRFVPAFVSAAYNAALPPPGSSGSIVIDPLVRGESFYGTFRLSPPEDDRPTGVHFEGLLDALGVTNALRVLAALLLEQRVIFVGSRWGHVTSCAHAATVLLYPLAWQHIFIPVLPRSKLSYAAAPMPFVLGVLARDMGALQAEPVEQVLFVDIDHGRLWGDAEVMDAAQLPSPYRESVQHAVSRLAKAARSSRLDNAAVAEAVLQQLMVPLLASYRRFIVDDAPAEPGAATEPDAGKQRGAPERPHSIHPRFDETRFLEEAPASVQPFLRSMRSAQLFEVFLNTHVAMGDAARQASAFERAVDAWELDPVAAATTTAHTPTMGSHAAGRLRAAREVVVNSERRQAAARAAREAVANSERRQAAARAAADAKRKAAGKLRAGAAALNGLQRSVRGAYAARYSSGGGDGGAAVLNTTTSRSAMPAIDGSAAQDLSSVSDAEPEHVAAEQHSAGELATPREAELEDEELQMAIALSQSLAEHEYQQGLAQFQHVADADLLGQALNGAVRSAVRSPRWGQRVE